MIYFAHGGVNDGHQDADPSMLLSTQTQQQPAAQNNNNSAMQVLGVAFLAVAVLAAVYLFNHRKTLK